MSLSRIPIRVRLTLPFALAMALVLAATGAFVYLRVGKTLLTSVDQALRLQAAEGVKRLQGGGPLLERASPDRPDLAQVLGPDGRVVQSSPAALPRSSTPRRSGARWRAAGSRRRVTT